MTDRHIWADVDEYFDSALLHQDSALQAALDASIEAGLPPIHVAPNQGKFIHLLAKMHGSRRILELGTLGGYSTIWLARALPEDGTLLSFEINPGNAAIAEANIERANLQDKVKIRVGRADDLMDKLIADNVEPFDFVFIDADKPGNADYLERALELTRLGSVILIDNVVRNGAVTDQSSTDANVIGVHKVTEMLASEPRLTATHLQTVGAKNYDGFILAIVTS